ncbi:MAG: tetratricopeptide repeat protein [Flavobacteriales bacterium]|nr:tetratricopeptide repeat protein [Flavobacteriales bacterium]
MCGIRYSTYLFLFILFSSQLFSQTKIVKNEYGKADTLQINIYQNKANLFIKHGDYDSAKVYVHKALEISEKNKFRIGTFNSYNIIANIYTRNSDYINAIKTYKENIKIAKQINYEKGLATTQNNIGTIYQTQANYPEALSMYFEAMKYFERNNYQKGLSALYNNIGNIFRLQGKNDEALDYYNKSIKIKEELGDALGVASCYNNIGIIYFNDKNYAKALEFHEAALRIREEKENKQGISMSLQNIGTIYFSTNKLDKANEYYLKSLEIKEAISDKSGIASLYKTIGRLKIEMQEYDAARKVIENAIAIGIELDLKKELSECYRHLTTIDSAQGNFKSAFNNYAIAIAYKDSIYNKENNIKLFQSQLNYEIEKKEMMAMAERERQKYSLYKSQHDILLLQQQNKFNELELQKKIVEIRQKDMLNDNQQKNISLLNKDRIIKMEQSKQNLLQLKQQRLITYSIAAICLLFVFLLIFVVNAFFVKSKKNKIILSQKEKVEEQNKLIEFQKSIVEEKNKELLDSILYAKRLQDAIFPSSQYLNAVLKMGFVFYRPKDIVSGDFYWAQEKENNIFFAVADCTGHGVPGALVSVVCSNALKRAINEFHIYDPGKILDKVRELVAETFEKSEEDVKDGMDISLCNLEVLEPGKIKLKWAGANNPLWIVRPLSVNNSKNYLQRESESFSENTKYFKNNHFEFIEFKANIQAICKEENPIPFTTHTTELYEGDSLYLFSDGFADQFGGEKGKKYKLHKFRELIFSIQEYDMDKQNQLIKNAFEKWKGNLDQVDDICVAGLRV